MVEFMSAYTPSMDRFEERAIKPAEEVEADIEKPIIPIGEIGTTSVDAGQGNILQELEKNIKFGAKKIQIVFSGRGGSGVSAGGGPTLYGKQVREQLREKAQATGVELVGVELSPATISGLAGWDPQSGRITEERRQADLKRVKDAVRFAADVSKGGGVDLWSQEFQRTIYDAEWNKDPGNEHAKKWKNMFYDYSPDELDKDKRPNIVKYLVDKRTGNPIQASAVRTGEDIFELKYMTAAEYAKQFNKLGIVGSIDANGKVVTPDSYITVEGNVVDTRDPEQALKAIPYLNPQTQQIETKAINWDDVKERTDWYNQNVVKDEKKYLKPEEYLMRQKLMTQRALMAGQTLYYSTELQDYYDILRELTDVKRSAAEIQKTLTPAEREQWKQDVLIPSLSRFSRGGISRMEQERLLQMDPADAVQRLITENENLLHSRQEQAMSHKIQEQELIEMQKNIETPQHYAYEKSTQSYAEAAIDAMKVTEERKLDKPVYIGPELGWAGEGFGGHPEEFVALIKDSRKKMEKMLLEQGYAESTAKDKAKTHIKGMVDTSHLAMWFKHFKKKDDWDDKKHLKEFNEWMKAQAKYMVEEGVVGGVQVVDSITGEHSHLPAGQGAFEVAEFVKTMKEAGFKGPIIAEGHEEDTMNFGQGRILTETWRAFGSNISGVGHGKMGLRSWGGIQGSYFGHVTPPTYIVGAYAPSNEWSLWSETPFE